MTRFFLFVSLGALALCGQDRLPALKGEFLSGRAAALPDAAAGKVTLLVLGFSRDSQHATGPWVDRFKQDFGKVPQCTFFQVAMIPGAARMAKPFIESGMRKGVAKQDHENFMVVFGGVDPWKQLVHYQDPDTAYLIVLDKSGVIRWQHAGGFDQAGYAALSAQLRSLADRK